MNKLEKIETVIDDCPLLIQEMVKMLMDEEHLLIQEAIKMLSYYYRVDESVISGHLKGTRFDCSTSNYVVCIIDGEEFTSSSYSIFVGNKISCIIRDMIIARGYDIFTACSIFMLALGIPLSSDNYGIIGSVLRNAMKRTWGFFDDGEFKPRNFVFVKAFKQYSKTIQYYHNKYNCDNIFGSSSTMKALGITV